VLCVLERHADMSKPFGDAMRAACVDWRNPSAVEQPADLVAVVLAQFTNSLQQALADMETVVTSMQDIEDSQASQR
jgi:hypothetical protein